MSYRPTWVLALYVGLFTTLAVRAQAPGAAPADDTALPAAPRLKAGEAPTAAEQPAPSVAPPDSAEPAPAQDATPVATETATSNAAPPLAAVAAPTPAKSEGPSEERCAQLMAQGNSAVAQAEGCGAGDQPVFAGSQVALTQAVAPASGTLPDADNRFAALSLYLAPRFTLTERWALFADTTLAYEQTKPDDEARRNKLQSLDTRVWLTGNLASFAGFTLTGGPRLVLPTSRPSWAARTVGTAAVANLVRPLEVLDGLALVLGGAYTHFFSRRITRQATGDTSNVNLCSNTRGGIDNCPVSSTAITQDAFRVVGSATLNVNAAWSLQASYIHSWALARKLPDNETIELGNLGEVPIAEGETEVGHDISRFRRSGSFSLGVNYQPADWMIATLSGTTSVCYFTEVGSNSATGGCAAGVAWNGFWDRNPIANRFSQLSLSFTLPIDAIYLRIARRDSEEKKLAEGRHRARHLQ